LNNLLRFIKCSEELRETAGPSAKSRVVIVGSFNAGKSTLLNNLLGEEVSPVGTTPTTPCLIHFEYGGTFGAGYTGFREKRVFHRREDLRSFLAQLRSGGRVDIEIPAPLLKKCRLVDTPGIDSPGGDAGRPALEAAAGADKVIYLFHQRGIEEQNRLFLHRLAALWKNKNLNDLSFWLNCNLGRSDGTSLETTGAALREIFLSQVRLNTVNTSRRESVEGLRLFLELELARENLVNLSGYLKELDSELPRRMKKAAGIKDDGAFLSEFWGVRETARLILESKRLLHSLPSVVRELEEHFSLMNAANLGVTLPGPGGRPYSPGTIWGGEIRKNLLDLIYRLLNDKRLEGFVEREKLGDLSRRIAGESFTVMAAGGFSTGKSTFFNALLKEEILPVADGPATTCVTRLSHGHGKTATVHLPLQVTLQIYGNTGGRAGLRREEVAALERWLGDPIADIARLEACVDGRFMPVDRPELLNMLNRARELFAAGFFKKTGLNSVRHAAFRLISFKRLRGNRMPEKVRVTFKNSGRIDFDFARPGGIKDFQRAVGPDNAFRIETVEVRHPAGFLKLADFVDTPGLDWLQKHHLAKTAGYIRQADICLVFLNARHILNNLDGDYFQNLLRLRTAGDPGRDGIAGIDKDKFFYLINFADVLTAAQRETVHNFVRKSLAPPANPWSHTFTGPGIFMISSLQGLAGSGGGLDVFLKNLEESILKRRGRNFHLAKVNELFSLLDRASRKAGGETFLAGQSSVQREMELRQAQEVLREARRKLKGIRSATYNTGR